MNGDASIAASVAPVRIASDEVVERPDAILRFRDLRVVGADMLEEEQLAARLHDARNFPERGSWSPTLQSTNVATAVSNVASAKGKRSVEASTTSALG